jgi:hypothetical protein
MVGLNYHRFTSETVMIKDSVLFKMTVSDGGRKGKGKEGGEGKEGREEGRVEGGSLLRLPSFLPSLPSAVLRIPSGVKIKPRPNVTLRRACCPGETVERASPFHVCDRCTAVSEV